MGQALKADSVPVTIASDETVPISAAALPLPADAATETTLALVKAKTDNIPPLGQALKAASVPVTLSSDQSVPITAAALPLPTGAATQATLAEIKAKTDNIPPLGQALMADSTPVVLASNQVVPVAVLSTDNLYDSSLFGGQRAHQDLPIFERMHDYPGAATAYDPESYGFDSDGVVGTATHNVNYGTIHLGLSDATVSKKARLRSHDIIRYQPGCMPVVQITGFATDNIGWTLKCIRRSSTTGVVVDNTEATVVGYNASRANRYEIRYAYLGVQTVLFFINGELVQNSTFAGIFSVPYMKTANLPLSVEVQTLASGVQVLRMGVFDDSDGLFFEWSRPAVSAAAFGFDYKCSSARLVGGGTYPYSSYGYEASGSSIGATLTPIFSIRPNATINGVPSRAQLFPHLLSFFAGSQAGSLSLVFNPTLTGATWAATTPSPGTQIDTAATVIAGGTTLWRIVQGTNQSGTYDLDSLFTLIGRKLRHQAFTGTADFLTFACQRVSVNFDPRISLTWDELR